ncbi:conserved Plasmodium protein, unknown function [Plasmodium ovale]|uniref:Uncharacterized protein n=2 Tax=Plasmodium ovale TaxID=36330 RepID=A0A1A8W4T0_PLAOA|nr:conserved Plasmodium membrane protein, unknown function [Plasmodium ovale curtisi]SBS87943.1 conserved Plasmodium membrane protein, unknown function [Plasmodium ovale curtisi]SCP04104.1 conserved Plasmodium protein, unknown function [Plasmodium ovale]
MSCFGKLDKCCCFPLAGGCIVGAVFHFLLCLSVAFSSQAEYKVWNVASNATLGCLITLGLILKNYIIFYIVAVFVAFLVGSHIIAFIFCIISFFGHSEISTQNKVITTLTVFTTILITLLFLNIYLSISRVLKAGGSGWEYKNYMEIENDKEKEKKSKEKEENLANNDYNA